VTPDEEEGQKGRQEEGAQVAPGSARSRQTGKGVSESMAKKKAAKKKAKKK